MKLIKWNINIVYKIFLIDDLTINLNPLSNRINSSPLLKLYNKRALKNHKTGDDEEATVMQLRHKSTICSLIKDKLATSTTNSNPL